ncbi:hypothetical protein SynA1560_02040 [Synechococcus sp. A15-60]|nr:hypothetical protein SynA1560_02040 [Synechococcus sp. A15-60]
MCLLNPDVPITSLFSFTGADAIVCVRKDPSCWRRSLDGCWHPAIRVDKMTADNVGWS